jgi:hypothetical protein
MKTFIKSISLCMLFVFLASSVSFAMEKMPTRSHNPVVNDMDRCQRMLNDAHIKLFEDPNTRNNPEYSSIVYNIEFQYRLLWGFNIYSIIINLPSL